MITFKELDSRSEEISLEFFNWIKEKFSKSDNPVVNEIREKLNVVLKALKYGFSKDLEKANKSVKFLSDDGEYKYYSYDTGMTYGNTTDYVNRMYALASEAKTVKNQNDLKQFNGDVDKFLEYYAGDPKDFSKSKWVQKMLNGKRRQMKTEYNKPKVADNITHDYDTMYKYFAKEKYPVIFKAISAIKETGETKSSGGKSVPQMGRMLYGQLYSINSYAQEAIDANIEAVKKTTTKGLNNVITYKSGYDKTVDRILATKLKPIFDEWKSLKEFTPYTLNKFYHFTEDAAGIYFTDDQGGYTRPNFYKHLGKRTERRVNPQDKYTYPQNHIAYQQARMAEFTKQIKTLMQAIKAKTNYKI